ncbi:MAG TPA: DUF6569 family protein [Pyrinomonadaceae bacterium]|nr:DUF6569 family protein [Pyrinomonadaceae bacterium]
MNKRSFAIVTAVLTFTAGIAIARLSLPNLFNKPAPSPINKEIQLSNYRLSGPYQFERLSIFLVHGPDANSHLYTPLQEAMERKLVVVHETGDVNELAIENVSDTEEVFVQAGDIVKGGKQDRVLSVDVILPAKSGRLPISAFCVESSRWSQRGAESGDHFTLTEMAATYSLKRAIKEDPSQARVWDEVKSSQAKVATAMNYDARSELSPSSLPLTLENDVVQQAVEPYIKNLSSIVDRSNDVIGFAFAIDDDLKSADVYASNAMFKRLWPRLLKAAAVEAIAEETKTSNDSLAIENVGAFLVETEKGAETVSEVTPRTHSAKRETEKGLFFETRDMHHDAAWIHRSYLTRGQ